MKSDVFILPAVFLFLFCNTVPVHSNIYQWVAENGVPHFTNSPRVARNKANVRVMEEHKASAAGNNLVRTSVVRNSASIKLDNLIREKEDALDRLEHRHRNELTNLRSDLGAREIALETCTRFPLPEARYGTKTYERDRRLREHAIQERQDAREAVRAARSAIELEKSLFQDAKQQIVYELLQLRQAKFR